MKKRKIFALIGAVALVGGVGTIAVEAPSYAQRGHFQGHSQEPHPRMYAAIRQLTDVRNSLQQASQDYHGHRVRAIELINRAIGELQQGISSDRG